MTEPTRTYIGLLISLVFLLGCGGTPSAETAIEPTSETAVAASPTFTPPVSPTPTPRSADVHRAEGAGKWYPADPAKLEASVEAYVSQAQVEPIAGRLLAVIVPHAGYIYSGAVAGYAYRAMQEAGCSDRTIAVIGDTHTGSGSAPIAVWAEGAFQTPLGTVAVDQAAAQAIVAADERIELDRAAFQAEHPVENQLPFLQTVCPGARIVPVVIRQPSLQNAEILANALVDAFGDSPALVVASTDLSHYHPYNEAQQIDEVGLQAIVSLDPLAVVDSPQRCTELGIAEQPLTMCSQGAVLTAMKFAAQTAANSSEPEGGVHASVLHYATSGDVPIGQRENVVGYAAVALWQGERGDQTPQSFKVPSIVPGSPDPILLSPEAEEELLALARRTIAQYLATESLPPFLTEDPALAQPMGAYVTYEDEGSLRGCLGRLEGDRPVYLNVQYAALAAALGDPRFPAVTADELEELTLEITLLQPMRQVESAREIQIGSHGVLMQVGEEGSALFLPQVPVEEGWDLEATLVNLCRKAGLPDDAWQHPDARFYVFAGRWFGENEP